MYGICGTAHCILLPGSGCFKVDSWRGVDCDNTKGLIIWKGGK